MFENILKAKERLNGIVNKTPVMTSKTLNEKYKSQFYFKCENFQKVGAFKFRGAYNAIVQLSDEEKARGVLTYSSGNHAQAVALVCKMLGIKATIVMPHNAPITKLEATRDYGAQIIKFDPDETSRENLAKDIQKEHSYTIIPPFDHINIVAGQGTAALELFEEYKDIDMLIIPCGGGGLISGSAITAKAMNPNCIVIGIEPECADDACRSFHTKTLHTVKNPPTIADGARTPSLGKVTFPLVLEYVDDIQTVTEESIKEAVRFFFYRMKLVIEPSGALGLAAILEGKVKAKGKIGIILSGGNVDAKTMGLILHGNKSTRAQGIKSTREH
ncbi:MAG: threo-3-hydroxy-L-aspartate ammonia-lyase [Pseudomonadota bacterium]